MLKQGHIPVQFEKKQHIHGQENGHLHFKSLHSKKMGLVGSFVICKIN